MKDFMVCKLQSYFKNKAEQQCSTFKVKNSLE